MHGPQLLPPNQWPEADAVRELLQADLDRTLVNPPRLALFVQSSAMGAIVFIGASDYYYGSGGVWVDAQGRPRDGNLADLLAAELQDALADGMFGRHVSWPDCVLHGQPLRLDTTVDEAGLWVCESNSPHIVGRLGELSLFKTTHQ